jgi:hypothetical protein
MFRPIWSSSGVIIGQGNCCRLLLIYKFCRCAYVFELVGCVLSCCVLCCMSCIYRHIYMYIYIHRDTHIHTYIHTYIHTSIHTYIHTYILWHVKPLLGNTRNTHTVQHATIEQGVVQPASRQRLGKHNSTPVQWRHRNRGSCRVTYVFCRQQPENQWTGWIAITWYMFSVDPCPCRV